MVDKKPIHVLAKDLSIDAKKVIAACNQIGIYAKGASKRLNLKEEERIITYFKDGKNASNEVIDISNSSLKESKKRSPLKSPDYKYFPNRLIKQI